MSHALTALSGNHSDLDLLKRPGDQHDLTYHSCRFRFRPDFDGSFFPRRLPRYNDASGATLEGSAGEYVFVTEEPPVKAFWSVTVYDSTTGRPHPNKDDRYHINNTTAVPNADGTFTFHFKMSCGDAEQNCLEVPVGPFDIAARYYLPEPAIMSGEWTLPQLSRVEMD